ncbi:O-antigen polysaccharide polymerase Wzy [Gammaproteobacteria bacterium]|nr:O-antigen polysaccharide polymerase Wzy [Gammaproteobacteria bacterium]
MRTFGIQSYSFLVFIIVILILVLIPIVSFNYSAILILLFWLAAVTWLSFSGSTIHCIFLVVWGLFFVIPMNFLNTDVFLMNGVFLNGMFLNKSEITLFLVSIFIFVASYFVTSINIYQPLDSSFKKRKLRYRPLFFVLLAICLAVVINFNYLEAKSIYDDGYMTLFIGDASVTKGLGILLVEQMLISLMLILFYNNRNIAVFCWLAYSLSIMLIGQRIPAFFLIVSIIIIYFELTGRKMPIISAAILGILFASPLLMFIQDFRTSGINPLENFDLQRYYLDIWNVVAISSDTLKAVIVLDNMEIYVSPFAKVLNLVDVFLNRIFDIDLITEYHGFGAVYSEVLDPNLAATGVTFASSSIAEAMHHGGLLFIIFIGIFTSICSNYLHKILASGKFMYLMIFIIIFPKFIGSVRNDMLGWLFEGLIYLALVLPFAFVLEKIFLSNSSLRTGIIITDRKKII